MYLIVMHKNVYKDYKGKNDINFRLNTHLVD